MRDLTAKCRRLFAALLLCLLVPLTLAAQEGTTTIDYDAWNTAASRAEEAIEVGRASSSALEDLRTEIAEWRDDLLEAQSVNAARIDTLQAQIDALGPAPAEGEEEAPEIAERRKELNDQLAELRAPVVRAEEAHSRAVGIVNEINRIIRERQTAELLQLGPSPLNPAIWPAAIEALGSTLGAIWSELSDVSTRTLSGNPLEVVAYVLIGGLLVLRGRRWIERLGFRVAKRERRGAHVWAFALSLGQIVLPMIGVYFLAEAALATGLAGLRVSSLLDQLPYWAFLILAGRWLAGRLFPKERQLTGLQAIPSDWRGTARLYATGFAILLVIYEIFDLLARYDPYSNETRAVLMFPVIVLAALLLFRIGRLLDRADDNAEAPIQDAAVAAATHASTEPDVTFGERIAALIGKALSAVSVVGPVLAGVGYVAASEALVFPTIMTLAILGLVSVLQRLVGDIFDMVGGEESSGRDGLLPVLIGFVLAMAALPWLALVWGARVSDLTDLWARFREGFTFGETRIAPTDFLSLILVFIVGFMITRLLQGALRTTVLPKTKLDVGGRNAIVAGTGYIGIFLAALIAVSATGLDLSSLAIVAGALSVGIGFGLQNIVSNFVSGIILLIERPISEGDWIEVGGKMGYVRDISVRSTRIETFDRTDVIVPNADLVSNQVTNWTRGNSIGRVIVPVGVAYGTDTRKVEDILREIAREHDQVLMQPPPSVVFRGFGADSLDFEIRAILRDVNTVIKTHSDMNHAINERFAKEGIEIPFAQRDVWLRNPEALRGPPQEERPETDPTEAAPEAKPRSSAPEERSAYSSAGQGGDGLDGSER